MEGCCKFCGTPYPDMTQDCINAACAYLDHKSLNGDFSKYLPATFNWHEFWKATLDAAPKPEQGNIFDDVIRVALCYGYEVRDCNAKLIDGVKTLTFVMVKK